MDNQSANAFMSNANFTEENILVQLPECSNDFENITKVNLYPYVDIETLKEKNYMNLWSSPRLYIKSTVLYYLC